MVAPDITTILHHVQLTTIMVVKMIEICIEMCFVYLI